MTLTKKEILAKRAKYFPWIGNGMGYHCASFCECDDAYADPNGWPWAASGGALAGVMTHPICHSGLHLPGFTYPCLYFAQDGNTTPIYPVLDGVLCVGSRVFDLLNPNDYGVNKDGVGIVKPQLYGWVDDDGRYWSMGGGIRKVEHLPDIVIYPDYPYLPGKNSVMSEAVCYLTRDEWNQYGIEATYVEWGASEIAFVYISPSYLDKIKEEPELALEQGYFCCGTAYPLAWVLDDYTNTVTPNYTKTGVNGFHRNGIYPNTLPNINYGFDGIGMLISRGVMTPPDTSTDIGVSEWLPTPTIRYVENSGHDDNITLTAIGNNIIYTSWQCEDGGEWVTMKSVIGTSYTARFPPGTYVVRCIALAGGSCITSEPFEYVVKDEPTVTIAASTKETMRKTPVTLTATTTTDNMSYRWQISSDNKTWADIEGAMSATYTAPCDEGGTYYFRCVVEGTITAVSKSVKVVVNLPLEEIEVVITFDADNTNSTDGTKFVLSCPEALDVVCMEYHMWDGTETISDIEELGDGYSAYGYLGDDGSVWFNTLYDCYSKAYRVRADYATGCVYSNIVFVVMMWDEDWCEVFGVSSEGVEDAYADAEARGGIYREY